MFMDYIHLSLRLDQQLHDQLFYIAQFEGRSGTGLIRYLIRRYINLFEQKYGPIPPQP